MFSRLLTNLTKIWGCPPLEQDSIPIPSHSLGDDAFAQEMSGEQDRPTSGVHYAIYYKIVQCFHSVTTLSDNPALVECEPSEIFNARCVVWETGIFFF